MLAYKFKVYGKPKDFSELDRQARSVNIVWNYCVNISEQFWKDSGYSSFNNNVHLGTPEWFYCDQALADEFQKRGRRRAKVSDKRPGRVQVVYPDADTRNNGRPAKERILTFYRDSEKMEIAVNGGSISEYDLHKLTAGSSDLLGLNANTIAQVCSTYSEAKKTKLKHHGRGGSFNLISWRGKKSRPWVPFKAASIKFDHITNRLRVSKNLIFKIRVDRPIEGSIKNCNFVKEADGWYVTIIADVKSTIAPLPNSNSEVIGIDIGVKDFLTCSNGVKFSFPEPPVYQVWGRSGTVEELTALLRSISSRSRTAKKAQLARKNLLKLETKAKRWREQQHYNLAHSIMDLGDRIIIGNLNGKFIQAVFGKKAKHLSIGTFKMKISWIAQKLGKDLRFVNEANTTKTCSVCGIATGPSGTTGLSVREWTCSACGSMHDRDINAAKNIARLWEKGSQEPALEECG